MPGLIVFSFESSGDNSRRRPEWAFEALVSSCAPGTRTKESSEDDDIVELRRDQELRHSESSGLTSAAGLWQQLVDAPAKP